MSDNPFPYRHRLAVLDSWLVDTLRTGMSQYREHLELSHQIARETGGDTHRLTRELCYAEAAIEQLTREQENHPCLD